MIFLNDPTAKVNIDGVEMTVAELKDSVIDSVLYRRHLMNLKDKEESL